jgi:hypothetical protein
LFHRFRPDVEAAKVEAGKSPCDRIHGGAQGLRLPRCRSRTPHRDNASPAPLGARILHPLAHLMPNALIDPDRFSPSRPLVHLAGPVR